ncbi:RNA-dependent RNA polymerase, partial [viral metagenome]
RAKRIVHTILDDGGRMEFPLLEDLAEVPYKPNKFPGFEYARDGLKTRKEADHAAQADAERAWVRLMGGEHVQPHYVRLGGRGKVVKMPLEDAKKEDMAKGRLILMLSQRDLKLLGVTEKPLTARFKAEDCPIYVGKSWFYGGSARLATELSNFSKYYCCDAEKFDSSLDPYMIRDAVQFVRSLFRDGTNSRYDAYWAFVEESLVRAPIIRDDGMVFWKDVGTTSGHSHNSIIQSICTLYIGYTALIALHPEMDDRAIFTYSTVKSLGDDNLLALCTPLRMVSVEELAQVVREAFGVNWFGSKSFATTRLVDPDQRAGLPVEGGEFQGYQFLGKYFRKGVVADEGVETPVVLPYRPFSETVARLAYPERPGIPKAAPYLTEGNMSYMRAIGNWMDAAGNRLTLPFLEEYLDWLEGQRHHVGIRWLEDDIAKMEHDYSGAAETFLPARRFTYEEWLDIVTCEKDNVRELYGYRDMHARGV